MTSTDDVTVSFTKEYRFEERFLALYSFQQSSWLCDVTIRCDDGNIPAHKVVLAATCTYYKHMFSSNMMESSSNTITMKGVRKDSLKEIIRYLYTNEISVVKDTALDILKAANLLCIGVIEEHCCKVLLGPISKETALDYTMLAEQFSITSLLHQSVEYLVKFTSYYRTSYNTLDINTFQRVMESDDLNVNDESDVFNMVLDWVKHDYKPRHEHFRRLLEHVRLPLLSPRYLVDVVEKSDYVRLDMRCRDLVDEAKNRHLLPKRTQGYLTERMTPRKSTVGYIFLVGGLTVKEKVLCSVERYDLPLQQSYRMPDMSLARSGLGCAIIDKVLYAIGGHDGVKVLKIGECMDFGKGCWTWVPQMNVPRRYLGVCADPSRLFAVGGQLDSFTTLKSYEWYDPREGMWNSSSREMNTARKYASVCYFSDSLYVMGGNNGTRYLQCCERYDTRADRWCPIADLPEAFGANGLCVWDGKLATVGGFDSRQCLDVVYTYSHTEDAWSQLPGAMSSRRTGLGSITTGHKMFALGGHSGEDYLDTVEMYDEERWTPLAPLSAKRGAMAVTVLENCYMTTTDPL